MSRLSVSLSRGVLSSLHRVPRLCDHSFFFLLFLVCVSISRPAYFCLAADINLLAIGKTDEFKRFLEAYKIAYREAKKISPDTNILVSFQYEIFKQIKSEHLKMLADLKPEVGGLSLLCGGPLQLTCSLFFLSFFL